MKNTHNVLMITIASIVLSASSLAFAKVPTHTNSIPNSPSMATMLEKVMPVVVNITVRGLVPAMPNQRGSQHVPPSTQPGPEGSELMPPRKFESSGSGVIVDASNGYIVTNAHVIRNSSVLIVTLNDGRKLKAEIVGLDLPTDVAVIQVKDKYLKSIPLANSTKVAAGDFVAAIGNPFGLQQTVTSGVISALNRSIGIEGPGGYENFIQTDASINPGNSGGALVNMQGELVGINTAILGPQGTSVGIGFAIPSNMVASVMDQLIKYHKVKRGVVGVMVQSLTPALADALDMPNISGALVTQVNTKSAAETAGLKEQDVITQINDEKIHNADHLRSIIGTAKIDDTLHFQVRRKNTTLKLNVGIDTMEKAVQLMAKESTLLTGVRLNNIHQVDTQNQELQGIIVLDVDDTSSAWLAGLRPGDVILKANGETTKEIKEISKITQAKPSKLLLSIRRGLANIYVVIT
jgi:serine protease Do